MALRRKERPLSPNELREKLMHTHASNWLHSEPLCALATPAGEETHLLPIHAFGENELLVICLLDAADYLSDRVVELITEWRDRYRNLPWRPVIVFKQKYIFLKNQRFYDRFKQLQSFNTLPLFIDPEGEWFQFFNANQDPKILFLNRGKLIYQESLRKDFAKKIHGVELKLQESFRLDDSGLPLPEVKEVQQFSPLDYQLITSEQGTQTGHWVAAPGSIATDDSQASISFDFDGSGARILAVPHPNARENTKAQILLNDQPLTPSAFGNQVHANDKGQAVIEINRNHGIYEIVRSDVSLKGTLKVKFMNAVDNPVIFYELRTTQPAK